MTTKEYLDDVFQYCGTDGSINTYKTAVQGRGEVMVERKEDDNVCTIIHIDNNRREYIYEVDNSSDLKNTIEYCLGPLVSDSQWQKATTTDNNHIDDIDDWDTLD